MSGNTLTYSADLAECGKAVGHGLRNMRPHGGIRVKVDSQVAYTESGPWESDLDVDSSHNKGPPF